MKKENSNVFIFNNSLIHHKMARLRDKKTSFAKFRKLLKEITLIMGSEVLKDLQLMPTSVDTPITRTTAKIISEDYTPFIVVILRAGDGMKEAMLELLPTMKVGYIGLRRVEGEGKAGKSGKREKVVIEEYLNKLPKDAKERDVIILDPMLASGTSASHAITLLKNAGVENIKFMSIISCTAGLRKVTKDHPDVKFYTAANDKVLLGNNYISPGLGDAGDRLYGTT